MVIAGTVGRGRGEKLFPGGASGEGLPEGPAVPAFGGSAGDAESTAAH